MMHYRNMKRNDPIVTESLLESKLDELENKLEAKLDERIAKSETRLLETFREYRDQILTRMDRDAAEQEAIREDQLFIKHDIKQHEARIAKLEKILKTS